MIEYFVFTVLSFVMLVSGGGIHHPSPTNDGTVFIANPIRYVLTGLPARLFVGAAFTMITHYSIYKIFIYPSIEESEKHKIEVNLPCKTEVELPPSTYVYPTIATISTYLVTQINHVLYNIERWKFTTQMSGRQVMVWLLCVKYGVPFLCTLVTAYSVITVDAQMPWVYDRINSSLQTFLDNITTMSIAYTQGTA